MISTNNYHLEIDLYLFGKINVSNYHINFVNYQNNGLEEGFKVKDLIRLKRVEKT